MSKGQRQNKPAGSQQPKVTKKESTVVSPQPEQTTQSIEKDINRQSRSVKWALSKLVKWDWKAIIAALAFFVSLINLYFYNQYIGKTNAVVDYVGLANIIVKPRSSIFKTLNDEEYSRYKWHSEPDDLQGDRFHRFMYYYQLYDSSKQFAPMSHSPTYDVDYMLHFMDTSILKGDKFGLAKVYEPKFQILNIGQSPAIGMTFKVGVKQSDKDTCVWNILTRQSYPEVLAGRDSAFPECTFNVPYDSKLSDTLFFRIRLHYKTIMNVNVDTNYYLIWDPRNDKWFYGDTLRNKYGYQPFSDEVAQ